MEITPKLENAATYQRASTFLIVGLFELTVGLIASFVADLAPIFNIVSAIAGVTGFVILVYCSVRPANIGVYDLLSAALMFGYGTSTLISLAFNTQAHQALVSDTVIAQYWYVRCLGAVIGACGTLHLVGQLDRRGRLFSTVDLTDTERTRVLVFGVTILIVYLLLVVTGRIGFMASVLKEGSNVSISPIASTVLTLLTPVGALSIVAARTEARSKTRAALWTVAVLMLLSQFALGRRVFLFALVTYVMGALIARQPRKLISFRNIAFIVIGIFLTNFATSAFYAMRIASWSSKVPVAGQSQVLALVPIAFEIYVNNRDVLDARIAENQQSRTFILEYLQQLMLGENKSGGLHGKDVQRAIVVATPSVLYWGKYRNELFEQEEPLANPRMGLPVWDAPNSILTAGVIDFGIAGLFIYPVGLCFVYGWLTDVVRRNFRPVTALVCSFAICQCLLSVESDLATYFVAIRVFLIVLGVSWIFFWDGRGAARRSSLNGSERKVGEA